MGLPRLILNGIRFGVLTLCFSGVLLVTGVTAYSLISGQSLSDILNLFGGKTEEIATVPEIPEETSPESPFLDPSPSSVPSETPTTQYQLPSTSFWPQYLYTAKPFTQIGGAIGGVLNVILDTFSIDTKYFTLKSLNAIDISGSLVDIGDGKYNRANGSGDLGIAGDFEARGSAEIAGTLYIGTDNGSGDDYIYFDDGSSQYLKWQDGSSQFQLSNTLELAGDLKVGSGDIGDTDYVFFDDGKSQYLAWDDANDRFVLTNDLVPSTDDSFDIGSSAIQWRNIYIDGTAYIDALNSGTILPRVNNTYNLGSILFQWADIYSVDGDFSGNLDVGGTGTFGAAAVTNDLAVGGTLTVGSIIPSGNITMPDDSWIGLGAGAGRLLFSDQGTDILSLLSANVGIGTTNPAQKLHVEGQCVTGDTLLKRKRRRKKDDGTWEEYWEDVRIDEIQPGDEIQTLDEVTGALVVSKVAKLMDMGKKDIIKLTTASGKTIRTTANHPYLVLDRNDTIKNASEVGHLALAHSNIAGVGGQLSKMAANILGVSGSPVLNSAIKNLLLNNPRVAVFIDAANLQKSAQKLGWQVHYRRLQRILDSIGKLTYLGYYTVKPETAPQEMFIRSLWRFGYQTVSKPLKIIRDEQGKSIRKANFDVEIATEAIEKINSYDVLVLFSGDSDFNFIIQKLHQVGKKALVISTRHAVSRELLSEADEFIDLRDMEVEIARKSPSFSTGVTSNLATAKNSVPDSLPFVKGGKWTKVKEVRKGDHIAVSGKSNKAVFEEITKIEHLPIEQVWDIEVEGTHNFVGNGIIAHNTYISGNLGLGTTDPSMALDIVGSANLSATNAYYIDGTSVLNATTLGSGVLASSLTSVGALTGGSIASGFGTIATANTITGTTLNGTTGINTGATAGTQRIDSTGNLLNIGNLTLSGAISGGTTYSGSGNITSTNGLISIRGAGDNFLFGNLGIGTSVPGYKLEVNGSGLFTTLGVGATSPNYTLYTSGTFGVGSTAYFASNVGIGTTLPAYKLDIAGSLNLSTGNAYNINSVSVLNTNTLGSGVLASSLTSTGALTGGSIASGFGTIATANTITGTTINGTTGINTGAVAGTQRIDSTGNLLNIGNLTLSGAISGGTSYSGSGNITSTAGLLSIQGAGNNYLFGNLGLGTTLPGYKLDINGTLGVGGTAYFAGRVGIGTTTPSTLLSIAGASGTDLFSIANTTGVTQLGVKYATSDGVYFDLPSTEPTNRASNGTFESDLSGWSDSSTLTLQPDGADGIDTYIWSGGFDTNYGSSSALFQCNYNFSPSLLRFSLAAIPSGTTITSATLSMYTTQVNGPGTETAYACLRNWVEDQATWNVYATGQSWGTAGGRNTTTDYENIAQGNTVTINTVSTWYSWNILNAVQRWYAGTLSNYGIIFHGTGDFAASVSSDNADAAYRPKLVVVHSAVTATRDTSIKYAGSTGSAKLIAPASGFGNFTQSLNVGDTGAYNLVGYAYTDGTAVTSADAELYYNGATITTTYTSVGGGWYKLQGAVAGANEARNYGIQVKANKTVYFDNFSVQSGLAGDRTLYVQNSGTGLAKLNVESTSTLNSGSASSQALIVKGAASQTANLQEWQNSSGTVLSVIDENGYLGVGTTNPASAMQLVGNLTLGGSGAAATKIINATVGSTAGGASVDESTTNLFANASFEHSTFSTSWSTGFNYDATATTFTPLMAKRNAPGPFTAAPILQGDWATEGGDSDTLTFPQGTVISGNFYPNFDSNQGSIAMWVTPEWAGNDGITHYLFEGSTNFKLYKNTSNNLVFSTASGVSISKDISAWVAGTTYAVVVRWDNQNTLDGTNYLSITVDDGTATVGRTTVYTPEAPAATLYIGSTSTGTNPANAIIEGLTVYRRPLWDGAKGINAGNGDEVASMIGVGGTDPTLATGSWDVTFALPTNSTTGSLGVGGTGEAWSHPHSSSILVDTYGQTTYASSTGWTTSGTPSTGPADMVSTERVYLGGYKWTADAANEGITQTKGSLTAGANYVVRAVAHSSSADAVRVVIYDVTNSATISTFDFGASSTRTAPGVGIFAFELPTIARNGSAADCTSIAVRVLSTAASQTVYLHQIEVQPNTIDNPSFETGAGPDPWIPSGWTNGSLGAGEASQETGVGNFHSGSSSFKRAASVYNRILSQYYSSGPIGGFVSTGAFLKWALGTVGYSNISTSLQTALNTVPDINITTGGFTFKPSVARITGTERMYLFSDVNAATTGYYDDFYTFSLSDVSLTATPANTLKSTESPPAGGGIRVDGRDTLTQPITNLTATSGRIRWKYTPRHSNATVGSFGFPTGGGTPPWIASFKGSGSNEISLYYSGGGYYFGYDLGSGWQSYVGSITLNAGTTYDFEINYTSAYMQLLVDGVVKKQYDLPISFASVPSTAYWGTTTAGNDQSDATFGAPTAMTASTSTKYLGAKSAYVDATADSSRYSRELTQAVDPNSTATHTLSAYVKMSDASAVTSSKVKFIWEGAIVTPTTYTALANNWYRVTYSAVTTDASNSYGVYVYAGYAAYVDGLQLEAKTYATSFAESTRTAGSLVSDNDVVGRSLFLYGNSNFYGNLLPGYSNSFDLGSSTNTWRNLYLSGNVGIGTTNPLTALDVAGTSWLRGVAGGTSGLYVNSSGNVGIGTTNPERALHVQQAIDSSILPVVIARNTSSGTSAQTRIQLFNNSGTDANTNGFALGLSSSANTSYGANAAMINNYENGPILFVNKWTELARLTSSGSFGIGTTLPGAKLDVVKDSGTVAIFNRTTNDGTIVSLQQAGIEEGTISVSDTTVSYNAFTGSHYGISSEETERGWLVSATGINTKLHNNETSEVVYGVTPTSLENDPMAFGIYLSKLEPSKEIGPDNPELIASLGNMDLWVVDSGEDVKAGDYLISSNTKGHAIKDNKANSVSYVIAQAMEGISWKDVTETVSGSTVKHKKISVLIDRMIVSNGLNVETRHASSLQNDLASATVASSLTVEDNLTVLGTTSLNTLSVAGQTILGANMIFSDDGQSINTLSGNLKLQPLAKAGIDLFAGKVVFDVKGNITTLGEITASKVNVKASAGIAVVESGKNFIDIPTESYKSTSLVFVTAREETDITLSFSLKDSIAGKSIRIISTKPLSKNLQFNWWVIN
jgi:uncharacterized LabA/DUF88 family protein